MFELLALLALAVAVVFVVSLIGAFLSLAFWLVLLPFKLLALGFKAIAALFLLPLAALVVGIVGLAVGLPLLLLVVVPLAPFVLLFVLIVWLARRGTRQVAPGA